VGLWGFGVLVLWDRHDVATGAWELNIPCSLGLVPAEKIDILVTVATHDCKDREGSNNKGKEAKKDRAT
jgi:hypothetical protein